MRYSHSILAGILSPWPRTTTVLEGYGLIKSLLYPLCLYILVPPLPISREILAYYICSGNPAIRWSMINFKVTTAPDILMDHWERYVHNYFMAYNMHTEFFIQHKTTIIKCFNLFCNDWLSDMTFSILTFIPQVFTTKIFYQCTISFHSN